MKTTSRILIIGAVVTAFSCQENQGALNKFSDPVLIAIYDFKDRRLPDSLYQFFSSPNEVYREEAVLAFASIQDSSGIGALGKMLNDESSRVRAAAAFSMGQIKSSLTETLLVESLKTEEEKSVTEELTEAYGKVTKRWSLTRVGIDALGSERVSWSIYRAGLRGMANAHLDSIAAIMLGPSNDNSTRLGAAHYFSRTAKNFEKFESTLINSASDDSSFEVRMASTLALGKIVSDSCLSALRQILKNEEDYRVRVNAVRALRSFEFKKIQPDLLYALGDTNINVSIAASEVMASEIDQQSWKDLLLLCRNTRNVRVRASLYSGILGHEGRRPPRR